MLFPFPFPLLEVCGRTKFGDGGEDAGEVAAEEAGEKLSEGVLSEEVLDVDCCLSRCGRASFARLRNGKLNEGMR